MAFGYKSIDRCLYCILPDNSKTDESLRRKAIGPKDPMINGSQLPNEVTYSNEYHCFTVFTAYEDRLISGRMVVTMTHVTQLGTLPGCIFIYLNQSVPERLTIVD